MGKFITASVTILLSLMSHALAHLSGLDRGDTLVAFHQVADLTR